MSSRNCILMSRIIRLFSLLFLLAAFGFREPKYCKIVDSITKSYLKDFAAPRQLLLYGYGGAMMNDIQQITLRFFSLDALNVDEARKLYVDMMEEFLCRVNSHEKVRSYLHVFPFGIDNIKLNISFLDSQGHTRSDGHVAMVFIGRNHTVYYEIFDPITREFHTLNKESYEDACKSAIEH